MATSTSSKYRPLNARRPLTLGALGRRYRKHRYDPLLTPGDDGEPGEEATGWTDFEDHPWLDCPCCKPLDPEETRRTYRRNQRLDAIWAVVTDSPAGTVRFALDRAGLLTHVAPSGAARLEQRPEQLRHLVAEFIDEAPQHCSAQNLAMSPRELERCHEIVRLVREEEKKHFRAWERTSRYTIQRFIARLFALRPLWVRPLEEWRPPAGFTAIWSANLAEHLLCRYTVPPFLTQAMALAVDKQLLWFALLAQGVGLTAAAQTCRWRIPKGFEGALYDVPASANFLSGLVWAEVLRQGGGQREFACLTGGYVDMDITDSAVPAGEARFLTETVRWLVQRGAQLGSTECERIVNWARHEHTQRELVGREFSWKHLGVATALRRADVYREALQRRTRTDLSWSPHAWDDTLADEEGAVWSFEELTSSAALRSEGEAMRHCVSTYDVACARGETVVVAVKRDGMRVLTLDIDPSKPQLRQIRGYANRAASGDELAVVERWFTASRSAWPAARD